MVNVRTLLLSRFLFIVVVASILGYISGQDEWRFYNVISSMSYEEAQQYMLDHWELPNEPYAVWKTMIITVAFALTFAGLYELVTLGGLMLVLKYRRQADRLSTEQDPYV